MDSGSLDGLLHVFPYPEVPHHDLGNAGNDSGAAGGSNHLKRCQFLHRVAYSVTRSGNLLGFGQLLNAFGNT